MGDGAVGVWKSNFQRVTTGCHLNSHAPDEQGLFIIPYYFLFNFYYFFLVHFFPGAIPTG